MVAPASDVMDRFCGADKIAPDARLKTGVLTWTVYAMLDTPLLDIPGAVAMALIVWFWVRLIEVVYLVDPVVGVRPTR